MNKSWLEWRNQQEQSSNGVLQIRFFEKLRKTLRKIPVTEPLFPKVSGLGCGTLLKSDSSKDFFM